MNGRELDGRAALVTGASRNIGRAIAVALASGGAGVLVHAHRDQGGAGETARQVEAAGGRAVIALGDLAEPETPARIVESALAAFGRLDIVVANAAIRPEAALAD
ncbi:MAG: fabG, partial [Rhizobiaceae bacterium]|nr:fabG [Rhizobiaceae bacterium]